MKKETIKYIIQLIVAILTAIGTTLGVTSCMRKTKPQPQNQEEQTYEVVDSNIAEDFSLTNPENLDLYDE